MGYNGFFIIIKPFKIKSFYFTKLFLIHFRDIPFVLLLCSPLYQYPLNCQYYLSPLWYWKLPFHIIKHGMQQNFRAIANGILREKIVDNNEADEHLWLCSLSLLLR